MRQRSRQVVVVEWFGDSDVGRRSDSTVCMSQGSNVHNFRLSGFEVQEREHFAERIR